MHNHHRATPKAANHLSYDPPVTSGATKHRTSRHPDPKARPEVDSGPRTRAEGRVDGWQIGLAVCVIAGAIARLWALDRPATLFPDEAYSAYAAHLGGVDIWNYVRSSDPHPPLSYFVLWPIEAISKSEVALRLPSALASIASLAVMAWWQRRRQLEGLAVTLFFALSPTQIFFAHQVRMYGLLQLLGVVAALAATRWLQTSRHKWTAVAGVAGLLAAFSHAAGWVLLLGLFALPGLRRDRIALVWRTAIGGAVLLYAAAWGPAAYRWRSTSLYRPIDVESFTITVNELIAAIRDNRWIILPAAALGALVLVKRQDDFARVWLALFLFPMTLLAVVSLRVPMFIPKSLMVIAWGMPVALGALVGRFARMRSTAGVVVLVVLASLTVPYLPGVYDTFERTDAVAELRSAVTDGDLIVSRHTIWVTQWYAEILDGARPAPDIDLPDDLRRDEKGDLGRDQLLVLKVGDAPWNGRVWLLETTFGWQAADIRHPQCAPPRTYNSYWILRCVQLEAN